MWNGTSRKSDVSAVAVFKLGILNITGMNSNAFDLIKRSKNII